MTYPAFLGAVVLTSANNRIRFKENLTTYNADITPGTYFLRGDGTASDLCLAIKTALDGVAAGGNSYTVSIISKQTVATYQSQVTILLAAGTLDFSLIRDGTQTFDYDLIGFSATTSHGVGIKSGDSPASANWVSNDGYGEFKRRSKKVASQEMASNGRAQQIERSSRMYSYQMDLKFINENRVFQELALGGYVGNTIEGFMDRFGAGAYFEVHDLEVATASKLTDLTSSTLLATCQWDERSLTDFDPDLIGVGIDLYDLKLNMIKRVT